MTGMGTLDVRSRVAHYLTCLALALLPSCVSPPPQDVDAAPGPTPSGESVVLAQETPEPCEMAFAPPPELLDATEAAAARWSAATGCDISVSDDGIPMKSWPHLFGELTADGKHNLLSAINHGGTMRSLCGLSTWEEDAPTVRIIDIALDCDVPDAVAHEMGHALAQLKRHSLTGVMADGKATARTHAIDSASLELVCYSLPCRAFEPETP